MVRSSNSCTNAKFNVNLIYYEHLFYRRRGEREREYESLEDESSLE
jgi:hypothetical protein